MNRAHTFSLSHLLTFALSHFLTFALAGTASAQYAANERADVNLDGQVNAGDILVIRNGANWNLPTRAAPQMKLVTSEIRIVTGGTYENLHLVGCGMRAYGLATNVIIRNCLIEGAPGDAIVADFYPHADWLIENVTTRRSGSKGIFLGGSNFTLRGCRFEESASHNRIWWAVSWLVEDCYFESIGGNALKLHAAQAAKYTPFPGGWLPGPSYGNVFRRCTYKANVPRTVTVGTQDQFHYEITRGTRFEACTWLVSPQTQWGLYICGPDTVVYYCDFDLTGRPSWTAAITAEKWGAGPAPTGARIEGCTAKGGKLTRADKLWPGTVVVD